MDASGLVFSEKIRTAATLDVAWELLLAEAKQYGFQSARYGFAAIPDLERLDSSVTMIGEFESPEFSSLYDKENYIVHDATVRHCILSENPISWKQIDASLKSEKQQHSKAKEVNDISRDFGLVNGLNIPLRDANMYSRGGLGLQADPYENSEKFEAFIQEHLPSLQQMAEVFHCNLQRPLLVGEDGQLSPREKECLLWATYGLQTQQIADRIGTHPKTVEKQLYSARTRLNARTTTQAAIKAVILGLITP